MNTPLIPLTTALLCLGACRPPPAAELPVCLDLVSSERAIESDTRMLPPEVWLGLLVPGIRRPTFTTPPEPRDCSNKAIAARPPGPPTEQLPPRPLLESDLTFAPGPGGQMLVWARVEHFADGTARGPVALVRWVARGVEVRGVGTLWAPTRRVRLRLEPLGDIQLLVADSERCASEAPDSCARELQLLPLIGQRFIQADLREDGSEEGQTAPARVTMLERSDLKMRDGWMRRADVQRHVRVRDNHITIAEELRVRECDPSAAPELCRERLRVREDRPLVWRDGRFTAPASAWAQVAGP